MLNAPLHLVDADYLRAEAGVGARLSRDQLAVVIPARNEARSLRALVERCLPEARTIIVIDDASTDGTLETVADLGIVAIRSDQHLGKGGALLAGFRKALEAGASAVVTLDGDGQHDPADIPAFLDTANRHPGALIVGARLRQRTRAPLTRRFANRVADYWISRAAGLPVSDSQCGQRLYPRELLLTMQIEARHDEGFVFESEVLIDSAWRGFDVIALPIESRYPSNSRASHFRPLRDIWRITCMVARRTFSPERPLTARLGNRTQRVQNQT